MIITTPIGTIEDSSGTFRLEIDWDDTNADPDPEDGDPDPDTGELIGFRAINRTSRIGVLAISRVGDLTWVRARIPSGATRTFPFPPGGRGFDVQRYSMSLRA